MKMQYKEKWNSADSLTYVAFKNKTFNLLKPNYFDIITILTVGFIIVSSAFMSYISTGLRYTLPIAIPLFLMVFLKLDKMLFQSKNIKFSNILFPLIFIDICILANSYFNLLP